MGYDILLRPQIFQFQSQPDAPQPRPGAVRSGNRHKNDVSGYVLGFGGVPLGNDPAGRSGR